jgi:L-ascorbate metabolism protein UlaG (beta-lactamase superfamily)
MTVDQLPHYDAVLLSHLHGDHFDRVARRGLRQDVPIITTHHAARRLGWRGLEPVPLRTWEQHTLQRDGHELVVESLPGVHAFGVLGALLPPTMGSLLTLRRGGADVIRVYVSGDTLIGDHLDRIRERHGAPDVAVVHLGGTRVLGALVTLDAEGGLTLVDRLQPKATVPVHYGDYGVFTSPLEDFVTAWHGDEHRPGRLLTVERGGTIDLPVPGADGGTVACRARRRHRGQRQHRHGAAAPVARGRGRRGAGGVPSPAVGGGPAA